MADTCSLIEEDPRCQMAEGGSRLLIIDDEKSEATPEAPARRSWSRRAAYAAAALALAGVALAVTVRRSAAASGAPDAAAISTPVKGLKTESLYSAFTKTCPPSSTRGQCDCDCSWAQEAGGCDHDDGGCCYTCCCGEIPGSGPGPNFGFDCDAGFANWKQGWDHQKKEWCCSHAGRGCEENYEPVFKPFDCDAGLANWQHGWSPDKKVWCCHHTGRGCETPTPAPTAYDCDAGFANWQQGWSPEKKEWCCHKTGRGCGDDLYDCDAGYSNWRHGWSPEKKHYCCHHEGLGCEDMQPETTQPYDCDAGFANWQHGWSEPKKDWCCHHAGRGCPDAGHDSYQAYDCDAGFANWQHGWSTNKKAWCCSHWGRGCQFRPDHDHDLPPHWNDKFHGQPHGYHPLHPILPPQPPHPFPPPPHSYDCDAGFANWRRGWSEPKKQYCCLNAGRGCDEPPRPAPRPPMPHPTIAPAPPVVQPSFPRPEHCFYHVGQDVMVEYGHGWEPARVTEKLGSDSFRLMLRDQGTEVTRSCDQIRAGLFGFLIPNALWVLAFLSGAAILIGLCAACGICERWGSPYYGTGPYGTPRRLEPYGAGY